MDQWFDYMKKNLYLHEVSQSILKLGNQNHSEIYESILVKCPILMFRYSYFYLIGLKLFELCKL